MKSKRYTMTDRMALPTLIGWMGVCLLAASFTMETFPSTARLWKLFGCFALTSALGLEAVGRAAHERRKRRQQKTLAGRMDRQLRLLASRRSSIAELRSRIGQIITTQANPRCEPAENRCEPRLPFRRAVAVAPLSNSGAAREHSLKASIRDISPSGIGLQHKQPIHAQRVLVKIPLEDQGALCLVTTLHWRNRRERGHYLSGGSFVEVKHDSKAEVPTSAGRQLEEALSR